MSLKLISAPDIEPITLDEAKIFLRIDGTDQNDVIESLIIAARQEAEKITRRQFITATWELRLDYFPEIIYLPMPSLQSVTSVKYLDYSGTEQTLVENTDYMVDSYSEPARITPCYGQVWPVTYPVINAVRIRFKSGFGDDATDIPDSIRN